MGGVDLFLHDILFETDVHILRKHILYVGFGKQKVMSDHRSVQRLFQVLGNVTDDFINVVQASATDVVQTVLTVAAVGQQLQDQGFGTAREIRGGVQ